ncbi:unnamed protein product [Prorocentrum cordatum]|uniref:Uncharacterized protein n=1 Tax=Prorocentrum cordatum TaxID=2364126 RepID=A0ABN9QLI8_9DINO|nr:unnamed protein product [Polarella glacialis]
MPRGSPPRCICLSRNTEVVVEPCHADAAELAVGGAPRPREATRGAPPLARSGSGQQLHRLLRPSGAVGARLQIPGSASAQRSRASDVHAVATIGGPLPR